MALHADGRSQTVGAVVNSSSSSSRSSSALLQASEHLHDTCTEALYLQHIFP
jgi:hypothetical protein